MDVEIKSIASPDYESKALDTQGDDFCFLFEAEIGVKNISNGEFFPFIVCSPKWLAKEVNKRGFVFGRGYLVVETADQEKICSAIRYFCSQIQAKDWSTLAKKLGHLCLWEYEDLDYKEIGTNGVSC